MVHAADRVPTYIDPYPISTEGRRRERRAGVHVRVDCPQNPRRPEQPGVSSKTAPCSRVFRCRRLLSSVSSYYQEARNVKMGETRSMNGIDATVRNVRSQSQSCCYILRLVDHLIYHPNLCSLESDLLRFFLLFWCVFVSARCILSLSLSPMYVHLLVRSTHSGE